MFFAKDVHRGTAAAAHSNGAVSARNRQGAALAAYLVSPGFNALLFAAAVAAFCLHAALRGAMGFADQILAIIGNATCAWSWLVVRRTFRPVTTKPEFWPLIVVLCFVLAQAVSAAEPGDHPFRHMIGNLCALVSSAMLLLAAIEPLRGLGSAHGRSEKAFRLIFAGGYGAILATAVIWVDGAPAGSFASTFGESIKAGCAFLALVGIGAALWFRTHHPLVSAPSARRERPVAADAELGAAITRLLDERRVFTDSELRVAGLASMVGEQEYKVTRCITGQLGFQNFNQMLNWYRISAAMGQLRDPAFDHLPVLTIALDCGFGSIGPFNRAFKARTGMTPMQFRAMPRESAVPVSGTAAR